MRSLVGAHALKSSTGDRRALAGSSFFAHHAPDLLGHRFRRHGGVDQHAAVRLVERRASGSRRAAFVKRQRFALEAIGRRPCRAARPRAFMPFFGRHVENEREIRPGVADDDPLQSP